MIYLFSLFLQEPIPDSPLFTSQSLYYNDSSLLLTLLSLWLTISKSLGTQFAITSSSEWRYHSDLYFLSVLHSLQIFTQFAWISMFAGTKLIHCSRLIVWNAIRYVWFAIYDWRVRWSQFSVPAMLLLPVCRHDPVSAIPPIRSSVSMCRGTGRDRECAVQRCQFFHLVVKIGGEILPFFVILSNKGFSWAPIIDAL